MNAPVIRAEHLAATHAAAAPALGAQGFGSNGGALPGMMNNEFVPISASTREYINDDRSSTATKQESIRARRLRRNLEAVIGPKHNASELVAAFMKHRTATRKQLHLATGISLQSIDSWIRCFHASGVIRIKGQVEKIADANDQKPRGLAPRIWELQTTPFALPDFDAINGGE